MPVATSGPAASSSTSAPTPKSAHTSAPLLAPFLGSTFDPTAYLNAHLPTLAIPTPSHPLVPPNSLGIAEHAARTQPQLATLAAHAQELTDTLTTLTDDVLRSGARLAYAVELLRSEARALRETLREGLQSEMATLVPGGLDAALARLDVAAALDAEDDAAGEAETMTATNASDHSGSSDEAASKTPVSAAKADSEPAPSVAEPAALARLRTLHAVRARLQEVVATFDAALAWPLPPSALTTGGGLVAVSAPADPAADAATQQREEQGQAAQAALRERVTGALAERGPAGLLHAEAIVGELRALCTVWRGTIEERPRLRFIEGLAKLVAERRREEEARGTVTRAGEESEGPLRLKSGAVVAAGAGAAEARKGGLFGGLRRLRDEIYLE